MSDVCAQIADGLEKVRRGEMVKEDYETLKAGLKKRLPIFGIEETASDFYASRYVPEWKKIECGRYSFGAFDVRY